MDPIAHEEVIPQLVGHLRPIFESSPDGVYVWLDEHHWACNENLARLFGYTAAELENTPNFLQRFVHEDDQGTVSWNYWNRVQQQAFPVTFRFRGVHRPTRVRQDQVSPRIDELQNVGKRILLPR